LLTQAVATVVVSPVRAARDAVAAALGEHGLEIVGSIGSDDLTAGLLQFGLSAVVVIDVSTCEAADLLSQAAAAGCDRIVAFGIAPAADEVVIGCAQSGARGLIGAEASLAELADAVAVVARGEGVCTPRLVPALTAHLARVGPAASSAEAALTDREQEVARMKRRGLSNKQIAERLVISVSTVKTHVQNVRMKLGVMRAG